MASPTQSDFDKIEADAFVSAFTAIRLRADEVQDEVGRPFPHLIANEMRKIAAKIEDDYCSLGGLPADPARRREWLNSLRPPATLDS